MDAYHSIDYDKSITKKRLVYKNGSSIVFEYIWYCFLTLLPIGIITLPVIFKPSNVSHISIYYIIFCIVFDSWIIANTFLLNVFVEIDGKQKDINRDDIITALAGFYKLRSLDTSADNIIRDVRLVGFFHGGRVISVLLDDNMIYLNVTTLLRYDSLSCFNGLYNYYKCKRIAKAFKELQGNQ